MQQVKVPQDVQRADQILGPLNMKQLAILIGGLLVAWLIYSVLQMAIAIPLVIVVVAITLAFTFIKIHTWPFTTFLQSFIYLMLVPRARTWQKMRDSIEIPVDEIVKIQLEKAKIGKKIEKKTEDKKQVADIATLLDSQGGMKEKLSEDAEHMDTVEDDQLLQAAYYGKDHDPEAQKQRAMAALLQNASVNTK